jgi:lactoylglutathione lyase
MLSAVASSARRLRLLRGRCLSSAVPPSSSRFRVLGVQQIAVGASSKSALSKLWCGTFGVRKVGDFESESENVREDILQLGRGVHAVEIDIMEPIDPSRAPRVNVPPLNHIGLWVDDIHLAVAQLTEDGVRFTPGGVRKGAAGHEVTFIHPKGNDEFPMSGEGVLIELVQAPADVIEALGE